MSQQPLRITVYPNLQTNTANGGNGNAFPQQTQPEGRNPFKLFDLSFPQFNFGTGALWMIFAILIGLVLLNMATRR